MNIRFISSFFLTLLTALFTGGCSKDTASLSNNNENTGVSGNTSNTAPVCYAGNDAEVWPPQADDIYLNGRVVDRENNISTIRWTRISGAGTVQILSGETLYARVAGLTEGLHLFELTATDEGGLSGRDTVQIKVYPDLSVPGERIFSNRQWQLEWLGASDIFLGSYIFIHNVYSYLPPGTASFRAYIRRDSSPEWVLLDPPHPPQFPYSYEVQNGTLIVFMTTPQSDTPDIKLVY